VVIPRSLWSLAMAALSSHHRPRPPGSM